MDNFYNTQRLQYPKPEYLDSDDEKAHAPFEDTIEKKTIRRKYDYLAKRMNSYLASQHTYKRDCTLLHRPTIDLKRVSSKYLDDL